MGLLTPAKRKSVEPLAAVTAPSRVSAQHQSVLHFVAQSPCSDARSVEGLALSLPAEAWEMISWREDNADVLTSRFAHVRVGAAHRDFDRSVPRDEEWLLVEWPTEEEKPPKFWLATVPENVAFDRFVALAKLRWRIERDYQETGARAGLARLPSPCHPFLAAYAFLIAGRGFPLRTDASPRGAFSSRRFDLETARRSDRSVTSRTQFPPCAAF